MTPQPTWIGVIESIVKVGALILAGFWTVYVFRALGQREKANADLKKAQSETQKIDAEKSKLELDMRKAELDMRRVAILQTEIEATVNRAHDGVGYYILVGVNLKNIEPVCPHQLGRAACSFHDPTSQVWCRWCAVISVGSDPHACSRLRGPKQVPRSLGPSPGATGDLRLPRMFPTKASTSCVFGPCKSS